MAVVEIVVGLLPLLCDRLRGMTSKIMKPTKLPANGLVVELEPNRIPFNTALPVISVNVSIL